MGNDTHTRDTYPPESRSRMGGLLLVDKPGGVTSHDVVAAVRKRIKPLKVGHTGTLDPLATGLLILCVGEATKLARFIESQHKRYIATALLGVATDTQDITGEVLARKTVEELSGTRIKEACREFTGEIRQTPPVFSAVKVNGVRSHRRARRKEEFQLDPREVTITRLEIEWIHLPRIDFVIECSKGTYIRTLCHDIGEHLGVGACMESLRRTAIKPFDIADAKLMEELDSREQIIRALVPASEGVPHMVPLKCDWEQIRKLSHGMEVQFKDLRVVGTEPWGKALGPDGELFAVGKIKQDGDKLTFRPKRVLGGARN
jgi:tRNA pseudouridine55 synthase